METTRSTSTVAYRSAGPQMRASDADRDLALAELSRHFQEGRLTSEEFDERTSQALAARTFGELAGLMSDLPSEPDPAAVPRNRPSGNYLLIIPGIATFCALIVVATVLMGGQGGNHHALRGLIALLPALIAIRLLARRRSCNSASRRR
jgi:Domain of unknown function (DUF1707)